MVIRILSLVPHCTSSVEGQVIYEATRAVLSEGADVELMFTGVDEVTSSFVNTSFIALLDTWTASELKQRVRIRDASQQTIAMFRRCMANAEMVTAA